MKKIFASLIVAVMFAVVTSSVAANATDEPDAWWQLPGHITSVEQANQLLDSDQKSMFPQERIYTFDLAPCGVVLQGDWYKDGAPDFGDSLAYGEDFDWYEDHVFYYTGDCPEPEPYYLDIQEEFVCGEGSIRVGHNTPWNYGITAEANGEPYGDVVVSGAGTGTLEFVFDEDSHGGEVDIVYWVHAATEWDLVPDDLNRQDIWPEVGDKSRSFTVGTDCEQASPRPTPTPIEPTPICCEPRPNPSPDPSPSPSATPSPSPSVTPPVDEPEDKPKGEAPPKLADTGASTWLAWSAVALLVAGAVLTAVAYIHRRRTIQAEAE